MFKEKYFKKNGEIAHKLWIFSLGLDELKVNPNWQKACFLKEKILQFGSSPFMELKSTKEERDDWQKLLDEITFLASKHDGCSTLLDEITSLAAKC